MKSKYIGLLAVAIESMMAMQGNDLAAAYSYGAKSTSACSLTKKKDGLLILLKRDVAAAINRQKTFRKEIKARISKGKTSIYIMLTSAHHSTTDLSYIATRNQTGDWSISRVGRTLFELPNMPPEIEPETVSSVAPEQGLVLDRLLADPCLYAGAAGADNILPPVGQWQTSLAVVTPLRMYTSYSFGPLPGPGGKLVSAITGW